MNDFHVLDTIKIASPCGADWSGMEGDDRVRFCRACEKNVYNLDGMSGIEASELIRSKEGRICVRLRRRRDGTVVTSDCPVGFQDLRRRFLARLTLGSFVSGWAATGFFGGGLHRNNGWLPAPLQDHTDVQSVEFEMGVLCR